jgi:membrane-associated phospholipid phosphatase
MPLACASAAHAQSPSVTGQTGLISMPDARVAPDGAWRTGISFLRPYDTLWSSIALFPWAEASFRYTRIMHVPGFSDERGPSYGDFKDKSFDAKAIVLPERSWLPALAVGVQDVAGGTGLFRAPYGVASKQLGEVDLTLGYGRQRIDGLFGGARWTPSATPNWSVIAEYDAFNYKRDHRSDLSGAASYKKEPAVGIEYQKDWYGAKVFASHEHLGFIAYVSLPLDRKEFVPKYDEPPPYTKINPRPTEEQWRSDGQHAARLKRALRQQDFSNVRIDYANGRLEAWLTNTRISSMPRAIGRAARTMLSFAPLEVRELKVTYQQGTLPIATYEFVNVPLLQRYFNGMASREQLASYVAIRYAQPEQKRDEDGDRREALTAFDEPLPTSIVLSRDTPDFFALRGENVLGGSVSVQPSLSVFLNDPSGAFRYDVSAIGAYDRALGNQTFLEAQTKLTIDENVSGVTQASNSQLPHVRSDVAEYKRGGRVKLLRLLGSKYYQPSERVYARASAGIYEEMFNGAGGQILYLAPGGGWAADLAADWVKQRDFRGWFGSRDYQTVTAIASLNYRLAQGVTATLRGGRFLARDEGVRVELKRRFDSGFEVGAWYTVTNGHDITSPGTPSSPYHDKGIFMGIPLDTLLTRDTQVGAGFALTPWTRDVGQMVASPGDLYSILERPVREMHGRDGLSRFGDREDDYDLPQLGADRRWPDLVVNDVFGAGRAAGRVDWTQTAVLGAAVVLGAAALDKPAFRFADKHRDSSWMKQGVRFGNALPIGAVGLSALFAFDDSRPKLSDAGIAALEASGLALLASEGGKYLFGRERPTGGEGPGQFKPGSSQDRFHSFPSRHVTVMWATVTPYAEEFDMPWLYGVAALTNAARIGSREHWLSDTVGGAAIGYVLGNLTLEARRASRRNERGPKIAVGLNQLTVGWEFQ